MSDQATRLREIAERYCERSSESRPHVIVIASGKGGVGKSVIALNVGVRLAELGNTTVIVDADENLGNIDVMLGVSPLRRLGNIVRGEVDVEDALVPVTQNLFVLAGNSGESGYDRMANDQQKKLLDDISELDKKFDYVIVDTAAGIGHDVIGWAVQSSETVIVTNPEPTAVMDAYAMVKMISLADMLVPLKLTINMARSHDEADDAALKLQKAVRHFLNRHIHYLGRIPYDVNASRSIMQQAPLLTAFPHSPSSCALNELAGILHEQKTSARTRRYQAA